MRLGVTAVAGRPALEPYERFYKEVLLFLPMAQRQYNSSGPHWQIICVVRPGAAWPVTLSNQ